MFVQVNAGEDGDAAEAPQPLHHTPSNGGGGCGEGEAQQGGDVNLEAKTTTTQGGAIR
jgi:hypothetical protein